MVSQKIKLLILCLIVVTDAAFSQEVLSIDYTAQTRPISAFWAYFGYDEPNYTYMRDGRKLLSELADSYLEYYETYIPQFCPHPNRVRFFFDVYDDEEGRL